MKEKPFKGVEGETQYNYNHKPKKYVKEEIS